MDNYFGQQFSVRGDTMIKNLSGEYETVEYDEKKYVMLYDNTDNESYPVHWHNAAAWIIIFPNTISL